MLTHSPYAKAPTQAAAPTQSCHLPALAQEDSLHSCFLSEWITSDYSYLRVFCNCWRSLRPNELRPNCKKYINKIYSYNKQRERAQVGKGQVHLKVKRPEGQRKRIPVQKWYSEKEKTKTQQEVSKCYSTHSPLGADVDVFSGFRMVSYSSATFILGSQRLWSAIHPQAEWTG